MNLPNIAISFIVISTIGIAIFGFYVSGMGTYSNYPAEDGSSIQTINKTRQLTDDIEKTFNDPEKVGVQGGLIPNMVSGIFSVGKLFMNIPSLVQSILTDLVRSVNIPIDPVFIGMVFMIMVIIIIFTILSLFIPKLWG